MAAQGLKTVSTHVAAAAVGAALLALLFWLHAPRWRSDLAAEQLDPVSTPPEHYTWSDQPAPAFPIPPHARYLAGVTIALDPGHGGRAERPHWKRGPGGLREAEVNLRVAHFLRDFLKAVGAEVVMTRTSDVYLDADDSADLAARIGLANALGADLFISIHHNAADNPAANYTSLYYHRGSDHSPASLCAARHLLTGLNDALRLEQDLPCAVLRDELLYDDGLLVLRAAQVPAVLVEGSFHSNPLEEQRLREPAYNRREAYGYFLGLARWAQAGLPRISVREPPDGLARPGQPVVVGLDDGLSARGGWGSDGSRILAASLVVRANGRPLPFTPELDQARLRLVVPRKLTNGTLRLFVDFENVFGQHVLHPQLELRVGGGQ